MLHDSEDELHILTQPPPETQTRSNKQTAFQLPIVPFFYSFLNILVSESQTNWIILFFPVSPDNAARSPLVKQSGAKRGCEGGVGRREDGY